MLRKQLEESTLTLNPTLSDQEDVAGPSKSQGLEIPKAPKKKVLFNLDTIQEDVSNNVQKMVDVESDSDWNISSFEDDDIAEKK
jgi:hypothetical protein